MKFTDIKKCKPEVVDLRQVQTIMIGKAGTNNCEILTIFKKKYECYNINTS